MSKYTLKVITIYLTLKDKTYDMEKILTYLNQIEDN